MLSCRYGNWPHFVIATFDTHSLETCIALNLPCLDASSFSAQQVSDGQHSYGSSDAVELWWSKQRLALAILRRGYHVHGRLGWAGAPSSHDLCQVSGSLPRMRTRVTCAHEQHQRLIAIWLVALDFKLATTINRL